MVVAVVVVRCSSSFPCVFVLVGAWSWWSFWWVFRSGVVLLGVVVVGVVVVAALWSSPSGGLRLALGGVVGHVAPAGQVLEGLMLALLSLK